MRTAKQILDVNEAPITSMSADWTSEAIEVGSNSLICAHFKWSAIAPTGTLFMDYSGFPDADPTVSSDWEPFSSIALDGSFNTHMFLDAELSAQYIRFRFVHTTGAATLDKAYITRKVL